MKRSFFVGFYILLFISSFGFSRGQLPFSTVVNADTLYGGDYLRTAYNSQALGLRASENEVLFATYRVMGFRGVNVGRNYGFVQGVVNGIEVDSRIWESGDANPAVEPQLFRAIEVQGATGKWLRNTDTEYKMLNYWAAKLGAEKGSVHPEYRGFLQIVSERPYCLSCKGVVEQFHQMFPNITLILVDGIFRDQKK